MCVCLYVYITYKVSSEDFRYFYQILKVVCDTHTHTHTKLYITSVYILLLKSVVKYIFFLFGNDYTYQFRKCSTKITFLSLLSLMKLPVTNL